MPPLAACAGLDQQRVGAHAGDALWMALDEPWPISIMAITAATPMMMPSVVRADRMTLRRSGVERGAKVRMNGSHESHLRLRVRRSDRRRLRDATA